VADAVAAVAGDLGMGDVRSLGALAAKWPELVGEGVAAHARPRSLRHGVLTIGVDSGAWATELRFQAGELRDRAAALIGGDAVREVRVLVDPRPIPGAP